MYGIPVRTVAALVGIAALLLAVFLVLKAEREKGYALCQSQHAAATAEARAKSDAESFRRLADQRVIEHEAQARIDSNRAAAARVDLAASGVRDAIAAYRGGAAASNPVPEFPGASAASGTDMLALVLGEATEHLRALARIADERGAAGTTCEAQFDSLTKE